MQGFQDPIDYFLSEHEAMNSRLDELCNSLRISGERKDKGILMKALQSLVAMKQDLKRHFKEEEKALFPPFESYITDEGGAFMIMEHPNLILAFNELSNMIVRGVAPRELYDGGLTLISMLKGHSERESMILRKLKLLPMQAVKEKVLKELEVLRAAG